MYVELNKGPEGKHIRREDITPELIIKKCQYMVRPYKVGHHASTHLTMLMLVIVLCSLMSTVGSGKFVVCTR
jgi:hypothetical protein